jgi:hypothetical protein
MALVPTREQKRHLDKLKSSKSTVGLNPKTLLYVLHFSRPTKAPPKVSETTVLYQWRYQ